MISLARLDVFDGVVLVVAMHHHSPLKNELPMGFHQLNGELLLKSALEAEQDGYVLASFLHFFILSRYGFYPIDRLHDEIFIRMVLGGVFEQLFKQRDVSRYSLNMEINGN